MVNNTNEVIKMNNDIDKINKKIDKLNKELDVMAEEMPDYAKLYAAVMEIQDMLIKLHPNEWFQHKL